MRRYKYNESAIKFFSLLFMRRYISNALIFAIIEYGRYPETLFLANHANDCYAIIYIDYSASYNARTRSWPHTYTNLNISSIFADTINSARQHFMYGLRVLTHPAIRALLRLRFIIQTSLVGSYVPKVEEESILAYGLYQILQLY